MNSTAGDLKTEGETARETDCKTDTRRRRLVAAVALVGGSGITAAAFPLLSSLAPSARARLAAAPVEVDLGDLSPGHLKIVEWRARPVWILKRTPEMLACLAEVADRVLDPESKQAQQPKNCANATRSIRPNLLVVLGVCTHFGCSPVPRFTRGAGEGMPAEWPGGFVCRCHGASFDFAGRAFKNTLAVKNLEVPPHRYLSETRLVIGDGAESTT
ncbi:MAG: ubiquinol-cytochrome c reductase iron-sulfur subunit [Candidatus Accumulibacter sp.]|jgi:ubiquinol-cytochrome c reductase iron-sulfur subunit|nr:ubiquinol-cytochrome c reductase iron-sulfur subunit [Accumulibacter sp.]